MMRATTKARRLLAAAILGTATGPAWAQGPDEPRIAGAPPSREVTFSRLFQGPGVHAETPPAASIRWETDATAAFKEALGRGKPLVLFFTKERCAECRGICRDTETFDRSFADPRIVAMADRAVFARLDPARLDDEDRRSFQSLEIKVLPVVVLIDTRGGRLKAVGQLEGGIETEIFVARLAEMMAGIDGDPGPARAGAGRIRVPSRPRGPGPAAPQEGATRPAPADLGRILTELGFEVKPNGGATGSPHWLVTAHRGDWKLMFDVSSSGNGRVLWLVAPLGRPLAEDGEVSAASLLNLLMANDEIGPSHFSVGRSDRRIYLNLGVMNPNLAPEELRGYVEHFLKQIIHADDVLKVAEPRRAAPATAPAMPAAAR